MSKRKLVAIASADWHLHKFRAFDVEGSRLQHSLNAMMSIAIKCEEKGVPLLFSGDLLHTPKEVENETICRVVNTYHQSFEKEGIHVYGISGNHDMCEKNGIEHKSPSYLDILRPFKTFHKVDYTKWVTDKFTVWGLPYMNSDKELKKAIKGIREEAFQSKAKLKILLLHSDCPGAETSEGIQVKETEHITGNLDKFFKEWDLVLFGHIHKPQQLSKKCYMLGSPIHQNQGDAGVPMGYWEVYSDATLMFKHILSAPKFVKLYGDELPTNTYDYFIRPEQILVDEDVQVGEFNVTNSRKKLATKYCTVKGVKDKKYKRALIKILNEAE